MISIHTSEKGGAREKRATRDRDRSSLTKMKLQASPISIVLRKMQLPFAPYESSLHGPGLFHRLPGMNGFDRIAKKRPLWACLQLAVPHRFGTILDTTLSPDAPAIAPHGTRVAVDLDTV
ncbi:hypothetical protein ACLOJK_032622 [Asimina triloba]